MAAPVLLDKQNNTNVIHNNLHMACATVLGFFLHDACIGLFTHTLTVMQNIPSNICICTRN